MTNFVIQKIKLDRLTRKCDFAQTPQTFDMLIVCSMRHPIGALAGRHLSESRLERASVFW
jgi:hypothetical protein